MSPESCGQRRSRRERKLFRSGKIILRPTLWFELWNLHTFTFSHLHCTQKENLDCSSCVKATQVLVFFRNVCFVRCAPRLGMSCTFFIAEPPSICCGGISPRSFFHININFYEEICNAAVRSKHVVSPLEIRTPIVR